MRDSRLSAEQAEQRLAQRSASAFGAEGAAPGDTLQSDITPNDFARRLLGDLVELEDLPRLLDHVLPGLAHNVAEVLVPMLLESMHVQVTDMDEPDEDGNEHNVQISVRLTPRAVHSLRATVTQHVTYGLLLRRQGDIVIPDMSPADDYRPSHWGRPDSGTGK